MKTLLLLLSLAGAAMAQREYVVVQEVALTAAPAVVTIQQPATGAAPIVRMVGMSVYCSVSCGATLERNGTAATVTAATPAPINSTVPAARTLAFTGSDVGVGTVIGKYTANGGAVSVDVSSVALFGSGTGKNITLRTASITGTVQIIMQFREDN